MITVLIITAVLLILGGGQKYVNHVDKNSWYGKKRD